MTSTTVTTAERIRALNDAFRRTFVDGAVMITAGVEALPVDQRRSLLAKVRAFDAFTDDNDPHGEHDFGAVDEAGVRCFWKKALFHCQAPFCFAAARSWTSISVHSVVAMRSSASTCIR